MIPRRPFPACLCVAAVVALLAGPPAASAERVSFMQDWIIGGKHVPFLAALEGGFYRRAGLEVSLLRGFGSGAVGKALTEGNVRFGFVDAGTMVLSRARGMKLRQIGMVHSVFPMGWVGVRKAGIARPKDLEGKRFSAPVAASTTVLFPIFARAAGVDPSKAQRVTVDLPLVLSTVLAGKADFFGSYTTTNLPVLKSMMRKKGLDPDRELIEFKGKDYGLDLYSNGLCATDAALSEKPDLAKRFVRASFEGLRWSAQHPEEALAILHRKYPAVGKDVAREQFIETIKTVFSKETQEIALGWMLRNKMERTKKVMLEAGQMASAPLSADDLFTNRFLEKRTLQPKEVAAIFR